MAGSRKQGNAMQFGLESVSLEDSSEVGMRAGRKGQKGKVVSVEQKREEEKLINK